jgi:hypothetical protein
VGQGLALSVQLKGDLISGNGDSVLHNFMLSAFVPFTGRMRSAAACDIGCFWLLDHEHTSTRERTQHQHAEAGIAQEFPETLILRGPAAEQDADAQTGRQSPASQELHHQRERAVISLFTLLEHGLMWRAIR